MPKRTPSPDRPHPEPLLAVTLEPGAIAYAPGMRAGRWVFATGQQGTDFRNGIAPAVLCERMPQFDKPKHRREAEQIYRNLSRVMRAGGTSLKNVVRVDQYYTTHRAVDPYHEVRRSAFRGRIPPSTSNLHQRFLLTGQDIEIQAIGVIPGDGFEPAHRSVEDWQVHPSSGYSHALGCGDFVFAAGMTAEALKTEDGPLDPEARMPDGHLWKGTPIKLETEFILRRKLIPTLEAAGTSLENVVKAQVYLRDVADFAAFMEVWRSHFPNGAPATTLVPTATPGFIVERERIEINTLSLTAQAEPAERLACDDVHLPFAGLPGAVRAGDLLLCSGLMAVDREGLVASARVDPRQPFFGSPVRAEMDWILAYADSLCAAAGTSLENVVRIQQFHTDLGDFYPAYRAWHERLDGRPLPFSAVEVPFLPVPGCRMLVDLWIHAP